MKVTIIGLGSIGYLHYKILSQLKKVKKIQVYSNRKVRLCKKSFLVNKTCLLKFEISTLSLSTIPKFPTPEYAKYNIKGQPKPPAPITRILELNIFFCPETPMFFNINCFEYFLRSSAFNSIINLDF